MARINLVRLEKGNFTVCSIIIKNKNFKVNTRMKFLVKS